LGIANDCKIYAEYMEMVKRGG